MGHEKKTGISLKGPDENDALTGWRKVTRFRPGDRKAAKIAFNRRVRKRPVECDEDEAAFEDKVRKVANAPKTGKSEGDKS